MFRQKWTKSSIKSVKTEIQTLLNPGLWLVYQNWTINPSELSENPELWTHEVGSTQRIKFSVYCVDHEQYIVWSIVVYLCEARGPNFQTLAFLVLP